ncbi:GGDEF domain-containing protein, partial [Clostridium botulinum]
RDPLIGIYNRKHFFNIIEKYFEKSISKNFAIVMLDIDDFKCVNDLYGHQVGDIVLKETGKIVVDNLDEDDIVGRYGGEEIIIYISNYNNPIEVYKKIDKIRMKISENIVRYKGKKVCITASFGISYYPQDGESLNTVIAAADSRLYTAKRTTKNKVIYN